MKNRVQLSDHFTYGRLARYTLPTIGMMIFTSIYGVVDGFFVSNYVGKTPFAAVNFIMPFLMILGAVGSMLGTGGSALIAKTLGEGDRERANSLFSLFLLLTAASGVVITVLALSFSAPLPPHWARKEKCWKTAWYMGGSFSLPSPPICCNLNFKASFPRRKSPSWAWRSPYAPGSPT